MGFHPKTAAQVRYPYHHTKAFLFPCFGNDMLISTVGNINLIIPSTSRFTGIGSKSVRLTTGGRVAHGTTDTRC
jgi:hypothetical protein